MTAAFRITADPSDDRMRTPGMRILLTVPLAVLLIGCGSEDTTATVRIADFRFGDPVTVSTGTPVTWENADKAPHNVVGDGFKTEDLESGDRDSVTFDRAGTYDYRCTFHPFMKGRVIVS